MGGKEESPRKKAGINELLPIISAHLGEKKEEIA
jgi:hypothetical protein